MSDIALKINGVKYRGWKSFTARSSVQMISDSFEATLTEAWAGNDTGWPISPDDAFDLLIDDALVMSGYVDEFNVAYDKNSHLIKIKGRSKLRDLIDSSGIHAPFINQTFVQLATFCCDLFGLKVVVDASVTDIDAAFAKATIEVGETYIEFLKKLADERGVILTDTPEGDLLITRAGTEVAPTALVLGKNIISANATNSVRDRFYKYMVVGQGEVSYLDDPDDESVQVDAVVLDEDVRKARTKVIDPDDSVTLGDVERYGLRERNDRFGESQPITYVVSGFRHKTGLWRPNTLVDIDDSRSRIKGKRLIVSVEYSRNKKSTTSITVMPKEALDIVPLPRKIDDDVYVPPLPVSTS